MGREIFALSSLIAAVPIVVVGTLSLIEVNRSFAGRTGPGADHNLFFKRDEPVALDTAAVRPRRQVLQQDGAVRAGRALTHGRTIGANRGTCESRAHA